MNRKRQLGRVSIDFIDQVGIFKKGRKRSKTKSKKSSPLVSSRYSQSSMMHQSQSDLSKYSSLSKKEKFKQTRQLSLIQIEYQKYKHQFTHKVSPTSRFYPNSPISRNFGNSKSPDSKCIKSKSYNVVNEDLDKF